MAVNYAGVFENDERYQKIVNEFNSNKETILKAAKARVMDGVTLVGAMNKVIGDFENNVKQFKQEKLQELEKEQQEIINSYQQDIDYTSNEAKQFEVKYQLAENHDLRNYAQELDTDNMLEINLLRMELRKRGMDQEDRMVKNHVVSIESEYHNNEQFNSLQKDIATLNTLGDRATVINGEYQLLDNVRNSFSNDLKTIADENAQKGQRKDYSQVLRDMQKYTQVLNEL